MNAKTVESNAEPQLTFELDGQSGNISVWVLGITLFFLSAAFLLVRMFLYGLFAMMLYSNGREGNHG